MRKKESIKKEENTVKNCVKKGINRAKKGINHYLELIYITFKSKINHKTPVLITLFRIFEL